MKVLIVLAACIVAVSAGKTHYAAPAVAVAAPVALASTGTSSQFRSEDNYGNYNFGYDESHAGGSTSRREEESNGVRRGSYSLSEADGRQRIVNYIADADGFRASIQTNEPGVEPKDSADVTVNKAASVVSVVAAPAPVPVAAPAPINWAPAAPLPVAVAPAPIAVKGYAAPAVVARAPVAFAAPSYVAPQVVEAPAPRAFSYQFGAQHLAAPVVHHHHLAAPVFHQHQHQAAPAPIFQQKLEY